VFYTKSMSPRVAGRTLILLVLTAAVSRLGRLGLGRLGLTAVSGLGLIAISGLGGPGASIARAELPRVEPPVLKATGPPISFVRRPVAVIDLTNDPSVRDVANKLLELLAAHAELAPPAISDGAALVDAPPLDDDLRILDAQRKRKSAEQNLAQRNFRDAANDALEGQQLLLQVTPRKVLALYADLALALGQSRLGEKKDAEAREAFALTYRLDPRRTLDELHYLPEVVQTFEAAKKVNPGVGTIAVRGAGRVWIDGEDVGDAPGDFKASLGRHVVWLTDLLRETGGMEVMVTAARPGLAMILDGPLTRPHKVVRFRLALSQAQDPALRASAMKALAEFVNVHDAVLLSKVGGKILWQTWRDREPGFSEIRELGRDNPIEILRQLAPPKVAPVPPLVVVRAPVVPPRWYERRSVQLGLAATVATAIVSGYMWLHYTEPDRPIGPITFPRRPVEVP
jgi:hypothetical protein